jgi:1-acyl-sn-glycerol-3-phosphate acyltransferase
MMRDAGAALNAGSSVMIFPEGTRSPGRALGEFKAGAFELALRSGVPILPVVNDGTAAALPKRGFILRGKQAIRIRVLAPISPPWASGTDAGALTAMTRGRIAGELA